MILDSGTRREFSSGAVRDVAEGKGRCDLLPLDEVAMVLKDPIFDLIGKYVETGNIFHLRTSITRFIEKYYNANYETAILDLAKQYEEGAKKYAERNWQKGIPLHCFIDSGVRHYLKHRRGDTDEHHDRAFLFNMFGAIWTHTHLPEMIDLPFVQNNEENEE